MSQTQPEVRKLIDDIFGDSDDEDVQPPRPAQPSAGDADGLFESDEDEAPPAAAKRPRLDRRSDERIEKRVKPAKPQARGSSEAKRNVSETKRKSDDASEDEYDSDGEPEKTAEDDKFIDAEDEHADLVAEYAQDSTDFKDHRPAGHRKEKGRDRDAEDAGASDPLSQALRAIKGEKAARMTEEQKQGVAQELLFRMDRAAQDDLALFERQQPAVCKINMLEGVQRMLLVKDLQHTLLEFDLLRVLKEWIQPRDDRARTLSSLPVRKAVYAMLAMLPCQSDHLKRSGIGKTIVELRRHKSETAENKASLKALMEKWCRPIFSKQAGDEYEEEQRLHELRRAAALKVVAGPGAAGAGAGNLEEVLVGSGAAQLNDGYSRARTPYSSGFIFTVRPDLKSEGKQERKSAPKAESDTKAKLAKKMKELQAQGTRMRLKSR